MELPDAVTGNYEVFLNGVAQKLGQDFDQVGRTLVFRQQLAQEGRLGFWRWLSLFLGVAGTYRRHDTVDVVYTQDGRRVVATLVAQPTSSE